MDSNKDIRWVPHPTEAFVPGEVVQSGQFTYKVKPLAGQGFDNYDLELKYTDPTPNTYFPVHPNALIPQDNLLDLSQIVEPAMLHQLRIRFNQYEQIYTWISSILVSVNPFKTIQDLYTIDKMHECMSLVRNFETKMPAHIFSTAAAAYHQLCTANARTSISVIISGESGSGKTLANNLFLQFFSVMSDTAPTLPSTPSVPNSPTSPTSPNSFIDEQSTSQQIISSAVILEAFGNAKTVRNNNSSRFGKYLRLYFSHLNALAGASIESYLLEKSRITAGHPGERNYHIFYQLLAGLQDEALRKEFRLDGTTEQFTILHGSEIHSLKGQEGQSKLIEIVGFDDRADFTKTVQALSHHFDNHTLNSIWRVLAGILHLGNIEFEEDPVAMNDGCRLTKASIDSTVPLVCSLLYLDQEILTQALLSQKLQMGKEMVMKKKNLKDARGNLQSLVRTLYETQFTWLISQINKSLAPAPEAAKKMSTIGLLDIFGFEDFQVNSYEQLLINYTNERLQSFFNYSIFQVELAEYHQEELDIDVKAISYQNNQPCLDLIETGRTSIIEMIDDELKVPRATDLTLLDKLDKQHEYNKFYIKTKQKAPVFSIKHFATDVKYDVTNWLTKSKDDLQLDLAHTFTLSTIPHLRSTMTDFVAQRKGPQRSLGFKFRGQVQDLVQMLLDSSPLFIRCIKSNDALVGGVFDSQLVMNQMKYLGLMSLVKIREVGFPVRLDCDAFLLRYNLLQLDNDPSKPPVAANALQGLSLGQKRDICATILSRTDPTAVHWKIGKNKIFYRNHIQTLLERMRADEMEERLKYLQAYLMAALEQRRFRARMRLVEEIEHFLKNYEEKLISLRLHEIEPPELLPAITNDFLPRAQQFGIVPDARSHQRAASAVGKLILLGERLSERADSKAFLERAILANQEDMLLAAMNEVQGAYLTPYLLSREDPLSPRPLEPQQVDLDQFETSIATLFQSAQQLWAGLVQFKLLRQKTEAERTLDLAHSLIKSAQRLGVDRATMSEIEQLYQAIADEVAKKELERKRKEEEERQRLAAIEAERLEKIRLQEEEERLQREKEEEERKRKEEEEERERKQKQEAEEQERAEQQRQRDEEKMRLRQQMQKEQQDEMDRLEELERLERLEKEQLERKLEQEKQDQLAALAQQEAADAQKAQNVQNSAQTAQNLLVSPHIDFPTPQVGFQSPEKASQPTAPKQPTPTLAVSSLSVSASVKSKGKPDYGKISHLINTSNTQNLKTYLSQFPLAPSASGSTINHLMELPAITSAEERMCTLQLSRPNGCKPYLDQSALTEAVLRSDQATVQVLVDFGADVNAVNMNGQTALAVAVKEGKFEMATFLITKLNAAVSRFDLDEGTGNCIGHVVAQSMAALLSKFSPAKGQTYLPLLQAIVDANEEVVYWVENSSKHTAIQYFKKIIKSGQQQLQAQITKINQQQGSQQSGQGNGISQHGVKQKNAQLEKDLNKCNETLTFLALVKKLLFAPQE